MVFEALGLTEQETRIYAELVRQDPCRIDRLPALTGPPPEQIEATLKGLAEQSLLTHTEGARPRVIASPPDITGEVLPLRRMQELHTARTAMGQLAAAPARAGPGRALAEEMPMRTTVDHFRAAEEVSLGQARGLARTTADTLAAMYPSAAYLVMHHDEDDVLWLHPSSSEGIPVFRRGGSPILNPVARSAAVSLRSASPAEPCSVGPLLVLDVVHDHVEGCAVA
ncbi:hypothetical protein ACFCX0_31290 [Streptomyces sp. NPDC056352]|uniref:hypothetical protein n=1 Tax=Streptomyces sp. NPDC056352 TaxID=3345791 RepID=UPI0035DA10FA